MPLQIIILFVALMNEERVPYLLPTWVYLIIIIITDFLFTYLFSFFFFLSFILSYFVVLLLSKRKRKYEKQHLFLFAESRTKSSLISHHSSVIMIALMWRCRYHVPNNNYSYSHVLPITYYLLPIT